MEGSYEFAGLSPGYYQVAAYRAGFVGENYGEEQLVLHPLLLGPGSKLTAIDFTLSPNPSISVMPDEGLGSVDPDWRSRPIYDQAYFSPSGNHLAVVLRSSSEFGVEVWQYDLQSERLAPVLLAPVIAGRKPKLDGVIWKTMLAIDDIAWTDDNTFYARGTSLRGAISQPFAIEVAAARAMEIDEFPGAAEASLQRQETYSNDRYSVSFKSEGHGSCVLVVHHRNGKGDEEIARGSWELKYSLFDAKRSLVFYPKPGLLGNGAIVMYNLATRQARELVLPAGSGLRLLDRTADGVHIAYTVTGPCEPGTSAGDESNWIKMFLPGDANYRRRIWLTLRNHVCFVKVPPSWPQ